tara:strand:- start:22 stop:585 length:564 start_codon:yes stop_codon:yes gene_type:complete
MRIISGFFKGKKILEPKDYTTRPLKDLTKESIFNIIKHSNKFNILLENATVLDVFSGVGSFGLECLSRAAKKVVFVENYIGVLPILKKNLDKLKINKNYQIIEKNIYDDNTFSEFKNKFDIIFLDPPFKDKKFNQILIKIVNTNILNKDGIIIIHRHKSEKDEFLKNFSIIDEKKYGISKISFLTLN